MTMQPRRRRSRARRVLADSHASVVAGLASACALDRSGSTAGAMDRRALQQRRRRRLAHIGVLEELVQAASTIECVAGTSAGAMVGAAFASGRMEEFRDRVIAGAAGPCRVVRSDLAAFALRSHLAAQRAARWPARDGAARLVRDRADRGAADALSPRSPPISIPAGSSCCAAATCATRFAPASPSRRLLAAAVGGRRLVDGALLDPVPVGPTRELGATFVIAVSVIGRRGRAGAARAIRRRRASPPAGPRAGAEGRRSAARRCGRRSDEPAVEHSDGLAAFSARRASSCRRRSRRRACASRRPISSSLRRPATSALFEVQRAAEAIEAGRAAARAALPGCSPPSSSAPNAALVEHARPIAPPREATCAAGRAIARAA